ncbi:MAG: metallophosphoesterase family protein [Fodinibius sp.]|nr:metallophosphoesterase family protein [Fodinibius sp.]
MSDQQFIAIGDIHGCLKSMEALLDKMKPYYDRTFVFVGDYIDRGPSSKQVVDYLLDFQQDIDCVFLRGNHEQMLLDAFRRNNVNLWLMNGGRSTLESYGMTAAVDRLPRGHEQFYQNTRLYYDTDEYFFVHAGISPDKTIAQSLEDKNEQQEFLWGRSHLNAFETPWEKRSSLVIHRVPNRFKKEKMIGIDTGCVYDRVGYGKLTAAKLPEEEFIVQPCLDK